MEGGAGHDDPRRFVPQDDAMDLDPPPAFRPAGARRFQPKLKGKAKATSSSSEALDSTAHITGRKPESTAMLLAGVSGKTIGDSVETDEEEDAVVQEISVFCGSGNLGEGAQLYVMQHVLRPCWRPYELHEKCEEIRLKPKQSKLEVDLRIDMKSENYNQDVPEHLKIGKQTLSSSEVTSGIQYAIGVLIRNQFYLNPVHTVFQLRPSLAHLDDNDDDADLQDKKHVSESTQVGKPVKDKLASRNSNKSPVDEPWVLMQFYSKDSCTSYKYKQNLVKEMHRDVQFMMKPSAYLHFLSLRNLAYKKGDRLHLIQSLLGIPLLEERLKKWFSEVSQVNRFDTLMHLTDGYSEDDLFKMLHSLAYLVQGLWVCKSSLLYVGDEAIQRDYILLLFNKANTISHRKLKEIKLNPVALNSMLCALAYNREILGDWKFKEPTDFSFIKRYPCVFQEQRNAWSSLEQLILESIRKLGKRIPQTARASTASNVQRNTVRKVGPVTNDSRDAIGSSAGQTMSNETREHLPKALLEIFNVQKVRSLVSIRRGLREMALYKLSRPKEDPRSKLLIKAASNGASASEQDLLSVIRQVTVDIHGVHVLKSSGNPTLDPLRDVVINLFRGKEPKSKLKKREIKEAAQDSLKRDISDSECNQVINELCLSSKGELELKSGE